MEEYGTLAVLIVLNINRYKNIYPAKVNTRLKTMKVEI